MWKAGRRRTKMEANGKTVRKQFALAEAFPQKSWPNGARNDSVANEWTSTAWTKNCVWVDGKGHPNKIAGPNVTVYLDSSSIKSPGIHSILSTSNCSNATLAIKFVVILATANKTSNQFVLNEFGTADSWDTIIADQFYELADIGH